MQQNADGMVLWFLILSEQAGKQAPAGQAKVGAITKVNDDSACQNNQMQGQKKGPGQHAAVNSFSFTAMRDLIVPYFQAGQTPKQSPAAQQVKRRKERPVAVTDFCDRPAAAQGKFS